jgi:hypothetical protein
VLDQSGKVSKLDPKSKKYQFTGFAKDSQAWCYFKPNTCRILKSQNVVFAPHTHSDDQHTEIDPNELKPAISPTEGESKAERHPKPNQTTPGKFTPPPKRPDTSQTTQKPALDALKLEKPRLLRLDTSVHSLPSSYIPTLLRTPKLVNTPLPGDEGCTTRGKHLDYTRLHEYSKETL